MTTKDSSSSSSTYSTSLPTSTPPLYLRKQNHYKLQSSIAQTYATFRRGLFSTFSSLSASTLPIPPLPGDTTLSKPWLAKILINTKVIPKGSEIISVERKGLDGNRGMVGVTTRFHVVYFVPSSPVSSSTSSSPSSPSTTKLYNQLTLILKRSNDGQKQRLETILSGQAREALFYKSNLAQMLLSSQCVLMDNINNNKDNNIKVGRSCNTLPKVYYSAGSLWLGEFVILMEDIKARGNCGNDIRDQDKVSTATAESIATENRIDDDQPPDNNNYNNNSNSLSNLGSPTTETAIITTTQPVTVTPVLEINFVFGNQVWGLPQHPIFPLPPCPELMLESLFLAAADLHSTHWNDPRLLDGQLSALSTSSKDKNCASWLKAANWYKGKGRTRWEWRVAVARQAWEASKEKIAKEEEGKADHQQQEHQQQQKKVEYSEKFVKMMDKSFENASWENLQRRLKDKTVPFTLSHGDFHAANMMLDRTTTSTLAAMATTSHDSKDSIVLYDWSEVGIWEPTTDLGQTVISDVPINVFQMHAKVALRKYYDRLVELGAVKQTRAAKSSDGVGEERGENGYTFETCWSHFCRGGVERWICIFAILSNYPGMPPKAIQYFHDQMMAFIEMGGPAEKDFDITVVV